MALSHSLVTLNQTAHLLTLAAGSEEPYAKGITISVQNLHATHFVFIGDSSVSTSSYGYRIDPGDTFTVQELSWDSELYAVTDTGTTQVGVIRITL
jgi:hypothetical protein